MRTDVLLVAALVLASPIALAHEPPAPILTCQSPAGERYHEYLPPNLGFLVVGGDGNLANCGPNAFDIQILSDNGARCQDLKRIRDDPGLPQQARDAAGALHTLLCTPILLDDDQAAADYDGELDYGHGGVFLAVNSGDLATWGSMICFGMEGHHSGNIFARERADGNGPALTGTADYSRVPPSPGPKTPRPDCGDNVVEPCDTTPPEPSTQPFPVNVVVDTVNNAIWTTFDDPGNTCNLNDCAEFALFAANATSTLTMRCPPGIDGTYVVFIEPDLDQPDLPQAGHVWTD